MQFSPIMINLGARQFGSSMLYYLLGKVIGLVVQIFQNDDTLVSDFFYWSFTANARTLQMFLLTREYVSVHVCMTDRIRWPIGVNLHQIPLDNKKATNK